MKKKMLALLLCGIMAASPAPVLAGSKKDAKQEQQKDSEKSKKDKKDKKDKKSKEKKVEAGSHIIDDIEFSYSPEVRNDVTGNWRICTMADSDADVFDYCVDYYKEMFLSDDEIHGIVNFSTNTTSKISVLYDGVLDVCTYDYLDGEEHDAKLLFGGDLLKEDFISIETGEPVEF